MSIFSTIPNKKKKRSRFNMTHDVKTTLGIGRIVPYMIEEVLPGDVWNVNSDFMVRFAPMLAPVMHSLSIKTECFFVPNRLIWKDWQDFITGGPDGTLSPVKPFCVPATMANTNGESFGKGTLWDYLSLPTTNSHGNTLFPSDMKVDVLPMAAYQLIYQEYYRDQNLTTPALQFPLSSGQQSGSILAGLFPLRDRCWEKDYFTSALPFVQRGPQVSIPLTGNAPVELVGTNSQLLKSNPSGSTVANGSVNSNAGGSLTNTTTGGQVRIDPNGSLQANMSQVSPITVNDLRRSSAIQRFLESMARGGSRYIEQIAAMFGVISSDSRLQRPEYLGGGSSPCVISEVLQTSATADGQTPQANMAGHGIGGGINHGCLRKFEEHGFIVCLMTIRPRSGYVLGVNNKFARFDKFDYAWPDLANLGEQPIFTKELFVNPSQSSTEVFGYTPRYADWKYIPSKVTGEFRDTMNYWNLNRSFASKPVLSNAFVSMNQSQASRIFAAGNQTLNQQLYVQVLNRVSCSRLLPKYGVPLLM